MKTIGIIFAMKEEIDELIKYIDITRENKIFDLVFYEGKINNVNCILVMSGVGKVNAARCTQMLIDNYKLDYIINIGVAGGVSRNVNVLDIVVSDNLVQHDFDITAFDHEKGYIPNIGTNIKCDNDLVSLAKKVDNKVHVGTIASGDIFCTEKWMSEKINNKFNALCVEMEGASIAQVAFLCNIPFLVIRSISDTPYEDNNKITYEEFLIKSSKKVAKYLNNIILEIER